MVRAVFVLDQTLDTFEQNVFRYNLTRYLTRFGRAPSVTLVEIASASVRVDVDIVTTDYDYVVDRLNDPEAVTSEFGLGTVATLSSSVPPRRTARSNRTILIVILVEVALVIFLLVVIARLR